MNKIIPTLLILILLVTPVTAVKIIPRTESSWTCFDYSVQYAKDHPEWGVVTLSSYGFRGVSHMVNYQLAEDGSLMIHDGMYGIDYNLYEWENMYSYHFWVNGEKTSQKLYNDARQFLYIRIKKDNIRDNTHYFFDLVEMVDLVDFTNN